MNFFVLSAFPQKDKAITIEINDKIKFDMVYIKSDTFVRKNFYGDTLYYCQLRPIMGKYAFNGYDTISISDYYIAKLEVTRELYLFIMKQDPSYFKKDSENPYSRWTITNKGPVESISWYDACVFIDLLNQVTGRKFRLPTEAEWEYAAYGGMLSLKYSGSNDAIDVAWKWGDSYPHDVGSKHPNGFGLYDMSGNVSEWCSDWFSSDYYIPDTLYNNPFGPNTGELKVVKGGSWGNDDRFLEVKTRVGVNPYEKSNGIGFRLAMDAQ